ncbi:hypothetical protein BCR34DRAFT_669015 [Clohesyomyces aquaticus]|uniref:Uncharacterized protein n=1 Tax=Clohesyomyces aquaticus TaxID=1231657 RepID=A0A1Y1YH93_9PLEO|nr:hypothetical protein BCR34DRAFT_669015 [Clohesyomyces aquaticus]
MAAAGSPRPRMKVKGATQNPQYSLAAGIPSFAHGDNGRRLSPVSQLNTPAGRRLATPAPLTGPSYSEGLGISVDSYSGRQRARPDCSRISERQAHSRYAIPPTDYNRSRARSSPADGSCGRHAEKQEKSHISNATTSRSKGDRDRLPSQRSRNELAGIVGLTPHSFIPYTQENQNESEAKLEVARPTCPECGLFPEDSPSSHTAVSNQLCRTCRRFISSQITALLPSEPAPSEPTETTTNSPVPYPQGPVCKSCFSIPGYLYEEYPAFFPPCTSCGHMTDQVLHDLIKLEGHVERLTDDDGNRICASKELQDWIVYITSIAHNLSRKDSTTSIAESILSASASRKDRVRRSVTPIVKAAPTRAATLYPVGQARNARFCVTLEDPRLMVYTRKFSFDDGDEDDEEPHNSSVRPPPRQQQQQQQQQRPNSAASQSPARPSSVPAKSPGRRLTKRIGSRIQQLKHTKQHNRLPDPPGMNTSHPTPRTHSNPPPRTRPATTFEEILGESPTLPVQQGLKNNSGLHPLRNVCSVSNDNSASAVRDGEVEAGGTRRRGAV